MVTGTDTNIKQIQKTAEIQTFTNLWTTTNDTESEQGKHKIYNSYGHRHTKLIQQAQECKHMYKPTDIKKWNEINTTKQTIYDGYGHRHTKQNWRNPNSYKPMDT